MSNVGNADILSGYVVGRGQDWHAICLDLDIAAYGKSMSEAKSLVGEMVNEYLQMACEAPPAERKRMLGRRAPWPVRLSYHTRYYIFFVLRSLAAKDHGDTGRFVDHYKLERMHCAA